MQTDSVSKPRWARSDRFVLSVPGVEAEALYRSNIGDARSEGGRDSFDKAREAWAAKLGLQPEDGVCLVEVSSGPLSLGALVEALDDYGQTRTDALAALGRLWDAGLVCAAVRP